MDSTKPSISDDQKAMLNKIAQHMRTKRAAEELELMPIKAIKSARGHFGISQEKLATEIGSKLQRSISQSDMSRFERGSLNDRDMLLEASRYFRAKGWEADRTGASICVPPMPSSAK